MNVSCLADQPTIDDHQVPLLEDANEQYWIFDGMSKKSLINRLFTVMVGSVVCSEASSTGPGNSNRKRKAPTSKRSAKKAAKAKAAPAVQEIGMPEESDLQSTVVSCARGVRQKLWVDDLMSLANFITESLRQNPMLKTLPDMEFTQMKKDIIRVGLVFCFKGQYVLPLNADKGKLYRKWSSLRPALKGFAIRQLATATWW